jgi:hypothetical protein
MNTTDVTHAKVLMCSGCKQTTKWFLQNEFCTVRRIWGNVTVEDGVEREFLYVLVGTFFSNFGGLHFVDAKCYKQYLKSLTFFFQNKIYRFY